MEANISKNVETNTVNLNIRNLIAVVMVECNINKQTRYLCIQGSKIDLPNWDNKNARESP